MAIVTFKDLQRAGSIKRADAMQVLLEDIHEEPGFNLRAEGEDLDASIDALKAHIVAGGKYPALEVRPRQEGGVWVVDGHRRRRALVKGVAEGGIPPNPKDGKHWVHVVAFEGNDAERTARVLTSAERRSLSPLEVAEGYKRLKAFGWSAAQIAKAVQKTEGHVNDVLKLGNANTDVQTMVTAGQVSATEAVKAVKKHGEKAGPVLKAALKVAKKAGKTKVTAATTGADQKADTAALLEDGRMFRWLVEHGDFCANLMGTGYEVEVFVEGEFTDLRALVRAGIEAQKTEAIVAAANTAA